MFKDTYRAFWRTTIGRGITLSYRRMPRAVIFAGLFFGMLTAAALDRSQYSALLISSARLTVGNLQTGMVWLCAQSAALAVGVALAGASAVLLGWYGALGLRFIVKPRLSLRKEMKRTGYRATAIFATSMAISLLFPVLNALAQNEVQTERACSARRMGASFIAAVHRPASSIRGTQWPLVVGS